METEPEGTPKQARVIKVEGANGAADIVAAHGLRSSGGEGLLVIPATDHLQVLRVEAKQAGTLSELNRVVAAWLAVAEQCNVARGEMVRLAIFQLEVERELGAHLAQTVRHGGDRSRLRDVILPPDGALPQDVSPRQSMEYKKLAAIPEEVFRAYLDESRATCKPPSLAGALRLAAKPRTRRVSTTRSDRRQTGSGEAIELPASALDAISRVMTADVCVGKAKIGAKRLIHASSTVFPEEALAGEVLVAQCPDPETWLPALRRLRNCAKVTQAIVVLPAAVWADWFTLLREHEWSICFVRWARASTGEGVLVVHQGGRSQAFRTTMSNVGPVL